MEGSMRAIEATGSVDECGRLCLDEPLVRVAGRVRVLILYEEEMSERDWLRAASSSPAFDFLKDPAEDIYSRADGKPFRDDG